MTKRRGVLAGLAAAALVLAACGGDDGESSGTAATETTIAAATIPAVEGTITVEKAWARNSPMEVSNGAAYMNITSSVDDTLVGASVDPSIAAKVEIHETVMAEGGMSDTTAMGMSDSTSMGMSDTTMAGGTSGAMTMRPIEELALPAGETVELKPGGYHIMLIDLAAPLELGQTFDLTLTFGSGASETVSVEVREEAP